MAHYHPSEDFKKIVAEVKTTGKPYPLTVRQLLRYFFQERRSYLVVWWIRQNLQKFGVESQPDFESVYIDAQIKIVKTVPAKAEDVPAEEIKDPVSRLALLPAANNVPVSINRDADIKEAVTLMLMHDYSQLPVMQNERVVDGMISLRSIVSSQAIGAKPEKVRDCLLKDIEIIPIDAPLFDAVKAVMAKEVVLVQAQDKKICGLVTIADIGQQFVSLSEPFLILEHIENHIRSLLKGKFTAEQLKEAIDPKDVDRKIQDVSDLSFGEYIRLLENPDRWKDLKIEIDRNTFTKRLDEVRRIRNDVMHFHPDGISDHDLETLRETSKFFYNFTLYKSSK